MTGEIWLNGRHQVWKWPLGFGGRRRCTIPTIAALNPLCRAPHWTFEEGGYRARTFEKWLSPTRPLKIGDLIDQSNWVPWRMPSLLCALISYYRLQKILFGERISKCFSCRNSIRQHAQSAVEIHIQRKPGCKAHGLCNSPAASRKLRVTIRIEVKANMMLCLRGKHLTGLAVPAHKLLVT